MKATLGLKDNPFDPDWPGVGLVGNEPLPVDDYPTLKEALCLKIAQMKALEENLCWALFEDKAPDAPLRRKNIVLLILGVRRSGRSTLARLICKRINDSVPQNGGVPWRRFDLKFSADMKNPDPVSIEKEFATLRDKISAAFPDNSGQALVLIDNVPERHFERVNETYDKFPKLSRIFVVTSFEDSLKDSDLDAMGPLIQRVVLPKITAPEVRIFIEERVPNYLADMAPLKADPELILFPFAVSVPQTVAGAGGKPLGIVRTLLWRRIFDKHRDLDAEQNLVDAATADVAELRRRLIT